MYSLLFNKHNMELNSVYSQIIHLCNRTAVQLYLTIMFLICRVVEDVVVVVPVVDEDADGVGYALLRVPEHRIPALEGIRLTTKIL